MFPWKKLAIQVLRKLSPHAGDDPGATKRLQSLRKPGFSTKFLGSFWVVNSWQRPLIRHILQWKIFGTCFFFRSFGQRNYRIYTDSGWFLVLPKVSMNFSPGELTPLKKNCLAKDGKHQAVKHWHFVLFFRNMMSLRLARSIQAQKNKEVISGNGTWQGFNLNLCSIGDCFCIFSIVLFFSSDFWGIATLSNKTALFLLVFVTSASSCPTSLTQQDSLRFHKNPNCNPNFSCFCCGGN